MWYVPETKRIISFPEGFTDSKGISHPATIFRTWSEAELNRIGVHLLTEDPRPENYLIITGETISEPEVGRWHRSWDTIELPEEKKEEIKKEKVKEIKEAAKTFIEDIVPLHKQINLLQEMLENVLAYGADQSAWPKEKKDKAEESVTDWEKVKAIREFSNEMEVNLDAMTAKEVVNLKVKDEKNWS